MYTSQFLEAQVYDKSQLLKHEYYQSIMCNCTSAYTDIKIVCIRNNSHVADNKLSFLTIPESATYL